MKLAVLLLVVVIAGCSQGVAPKMARLYNPYDPMSAEVLAKTHPDLQTACEAIGSCAYLMVTCSKFDGEPFWYISVPGGSRDDVGAYSSGGGNTLDKAAIRFTDSVRRDRAQKAYLRDHPKKQTRIEPCGPDCK